MSSTFLRWRLEGAKDLGSDRRGWHDDAGPDIVLTETTCLVKKQVGGEVGDVPVVSSVPYVQ